MIGSAYTDFFYGNGLANAIHGGGGDDELYGGGGNDAIDGGTGLDLAIFFSTLENFQIELPSRPAELDAVLFSPHQAYSMVRDLRDDSLDTLINVERLAFTDTMLALDTAANENAGNAYLLYQAAFDRTPDEAGLGYWIDQMDNGANAVRDLAMNFILSDEFKRLYGPSPSVTEFMDLIYQNVLNRTPDAPGYAYWLDEFARDSDSILYRAGILNNFAIGEENVRNVASQIADGIQYQAYVG
jgi:Ca2+-binding RTX toxin-like protein